MLFNERAIFKSNPPDAAARLVAALVAEVNFAVLDDGIIPIGNIDGTIGSHFDIDGSEGAVGGAQEVIDAGGGVCAAVWGKAVGIDAVAAEVGRDHNIAELFGDVGTREDFEPAEFRLPGIESGEDSFCSR